MDLCASRPEPIPCFAEMGSTNPVFVLPGAIKQHDKIAADLTASYTVFAGQQCTKPGMVFLPPQDESSNLVEELRRRAGDLPGFAMLTQGIAAQYRRGITQRMEGGEARLLAGSGAAGSAAGTAVALFEADMEDFLADPDLSQRSIRADDAPGSL